LIERQGRRAKTVLTDMADEPEFNPILLDLPQHLDTDRLILRAPRADDALEMNRAACESIEQLKVWMPWARTPPSLDDTRLYAARSLARHIMREEISFRLIERGSGVYAGNLSLFKIDWKVRRCEIGYWLRSSLCGRGYMTEAVRAATAFAFEHVSARRVEIRTDDGNQRSWRVAERAGFVLEGTFRSDSLGCNDEPRDTRVYARVKT
jgi:RimJ/RimL family protein N-acetyltransferase